MDGPLAVLAPPEGIEQLEVQGLRSQESLGNWPDRVVGEAQEGSRSLFPYHPHRQPDAEGK